MDGFIIASGDITRIWRGWIRYSMERQDDRCSVHHIVRAESFHMTCETSTVVINIAGIAIKRMAGKRSDDDRVTAANNIPTRSKGKLVDDQLSW